MIRPYVVLTITVVALAAALAATLNYATKKEKECRRVQNNNYALTQAVREYKIKDSINVASIAVLTLRSREFKTQFEALERIVKEMGIGMKRVESVAQSAAVVRQKISAPVVVTASMDTASCLTPKSIPEQLISYKDNYISLDGVIADGRFDGVVECRDTITQVVHRVPRKVWFIRWGTKELRQEITSANPNCSIKYSRFIKIEK